MKRSPKPALPSLLLAITLLLTVAPVHAQEPELLWVAEGFSNPESVIYDHTSDTIYISSVNGQAMEKDGNGFLSRVSPDGSIRDREWIGGLHAPMGLAIVGSTLYVADIDTLIEIDIPSGTIRKRHTVADAVFLNDVTAAENGDVYVSDMKLDRIHRLRNGTLELWLEDSALETPNGVLAEGDHIVVGSWGVMTEGFRTDLPGHLKRVSIGDKSIHSIGDGKPMGNLDGVEADGRGGYYVTDWMAGRLLRVDAAGKIETVLTLGQGSADLDYVRERGLLLVPMMNDSTLRAYRVPAP